MSLVLLKAMLYVTRGPSCDHRHPVNSYFVAKSKILQASSLYTFYSLLTLLSVSLSCSFLLPCYFKHSSPYLEVQLNTVFHA